MTAQEELIEALWDASNAMCIAMPFVDRDRQDGQSMSYHQMVSEAHERILDVLRKHT